MTRWAWMLLAVTTGLVLVLAAGCGTKQPPDLSAEQPVTQPEAHPVAPVSSKATGTALLKLLPPLKSLKFTDLTLTAMDDDRRTHAVLDEDAWETSDVGAILTRIGVSYEDFLGARAFLQAYTQDMGVLILEFADTTDMELAAAVDRRDFWVTTTGETEVLTSKTPVPEVQGRVSYAFVDHRVVIGSQSGVATIARRLSGAERDPVAYDEESLRTVWESLPDGFTIHAATGNQHRFVSETSATAWAEATTDADAQSVRKAFVACFGTAEEASRGYEAIGARIETSGLGVSEGLAMASGTIVKVYYSVPRGSAAF